MRRDDIVWPALFVLPAGGLLFGAWAVTGPQPHRAKEGDMERSGHVRVVDDVRPPSALPPGLTRMLERGRDALPFAETERCADYATKMREVMLQLDHDHSFLTEFATAAPEHLPRYWLVTFAMPGMAPFESVYLENNVGSGYHDCGWLIDGRWYEFRVYSESRHAFRYAESLPLALALAECEAADRAERKRLPADTAEPPLAPVPVEVPPLVPPPGAFPRHDPEFLVDDETWVDREYVDIEF